MSNCGPVAVVANIFQSPFPSPGGLQVRVGTLAHDTLLVGVSGGRGGGMLRAPYGLSCVAFLPLCFGYVWVWLSCVAFRAVVLGDVGVFALTIGRLKQAKPLVLTCFTGTCANMSMTVLCNLHVARVLHKPFWHSQKKM